MRNWTRNEPPPGLMTTASGHVLRATASAGTLSSQASHAAPPNSPAEEAPGAASTAAPNAPGSTSAPAETSTPNDAGFDARLEHRLDAPQARTSTPFAVAEIPPFSFGSMTIDGPDAPPGLLKPSSLGRLYREASQLRGDSSSLSERRSWARSMSAQLSGVFPGQSAVSLLVQHGLSEDDARAIFEYVQLNFDRMTSTPPREAPTVKTLKGSQPGLAHTRELERTLDFLPRGLEATDAHAIGGPAIIVRTRERIGEGAQRQVKGAIIFTKEAGVLRATAGVRQTPRMNDGDGHRNNAGLTEEVEISRRVQRGPAAEYVMPVLHSYLLPKIAKGRDGRPLQEPPPGLFRRALEALRPGPGEPPRRARLAMEGEPLPTTKRVLVYPRQRGSFDDFLKKKGRTLDEPTRQKLMLQVLRAYARLHEGGQLQNDVKPGNLLYSGAPPDLELKISDLASTRPMDREGKAYSNEHTPAYASPELGRQLVEVSESPAHPGATDELGDSARALELLDQFYGLRPESRPPTRTQAQEAWALGLVLHEIAYGQLPAFAQFETHEIAHYVYLSRELTNEQVDADIPRIVPKDEALREHHEIIREVIRGLLDVHASERWTLPRAIARLEQLGDTQPRRVPLSEVISSSRGLSRSERSQLVNAILDELKELHAARQFHGAISKDTIQVIGRTATGGDPNVRPLFKLATPPPPSPREADPILTEETTEALASALDAEQANDIRAFGEVVRELFAGAAVPDPVRAVFESMCREDPALRPTAHALIRDLAEAQREVVARRQARPRPAAGGLALAPAIASPPTAREA